MSQEYSKHLILPLSFLDEEGNAVEINIPAKYEVCSDCEGKGLVLHAAFRGVAYSPEVFAEDPDFAEGYFGGRYDVPCPTCHGIRVELVPDPDSARWLPEHAEALREKERQDYDDAVFEAMCEAERRMGA